MAKHEITVSEEVHDIAKKYAEMHSERSGEKVTISDMLSSFAETGAFRRVAANRWAKKKKNPTPAAPKKAKKAAAPKKAKAKGPLARKQASKAKAPKVRKAKTVNPAESMSTPQVSEGEAGTSAADLD